MAIEGKRFVKLSPEEVETLRKVVKAYDQAEEGPVEVSWCVLYEKWAPYRALSATSRLGTVDLVWERDAIVVRLDGPCPAQYLLDVLRKAPSYAHHVFDPQPVCGVKRWQTIKEWLGDTGKLEEPS